MFGTLVLRTRAQTEMYPSCFALVIILKEVHDLMDIRGLNHKRCASAKFGGREFLVREGSPDMAKRWM
mgnify:CR=1 FL=1